MTTQLKLDYDNITVKDVQLIFHHRGWFIKYFNIQKLDCYETTNGYHVKITIEEDMKPEQIALFQILMGSDINREIFNFLRMFDGQLVEHYNRLYTKKYLILGTEPREIGSETYCPELQERIINELKEAKDLKGKI